MVDILIKEYHTCGHFSTNNTQKDILQRFWFPHNRRAISRIVTNCFCRSSKSYGHNPRSSYFRSSYFEQRWVHVYGPPSVIHSDQGLQFRDTIFKKMKNDWNIQTSSSSIYHPKGNSIIERVHRTLKDRLRTMSGHWSENLSEAVFNCNRLSGAFSAVFHRTAIPCCDWPEPSDFIQRPEPLSGPKAGDLVTIRNRKPRNTLSPRFAGNFKVAQRHGNSVILEDGRQVNLHDCILVKGSQESDR